MALKTRVGAVQFFRWTNPDTEPTTLAAEYHFPELYFWQKSSAKEICLFAGREVVSRLQPGKAISCKHLGWVCHANVVTVQGMHLGCTVLSDEKYPQRTAHTLITKATDLLLEANSIPQLRQYAKDTYLPCPGLAEMLVKFQNPDEADPICKVQKQLDETKEELLETLEALLRRGERLEDLAEKSKDLGFKSKAFLRKTEDLNSCCVLF